MPASKVLVVDDEKGMREFLTIMLEKEGYTVTAASSGSQAIEYLHKHDFDLVITDIKMTPVDGLQVLDAVNELHPQTPVIMITAFASTETAVEAMKKGAYDYIMKPFQIDEMKLIVYNALRKRHLERENQYLRRKLAETHRPPLLVGRGARMAVVFDLIRKVADEKSTVLITGESGTGKELVARAIHLQSSRCDKPFLTVNCGALPEHLLESELFGHQKGAFTGAIANKIGLLEAAHGGTFFLDEIGEMPPSLQVKLLRVLQEKEFKRVGGTQTIRVDIRIIAATNKDLRRAVDEGQFREDLFYRLNVIHIEVPPLRERREDIPLLVEHFIQKYSLERKRKPKRVAPATMKIFEAYHWPGNVRELENVIERAMILEPGDVITPASLPENLYERPSTPLPNDFDLPQEGIDLKKVLERIEREYLLKALTQENWGIKRAARRLNLSFRSMRYLIKKHRLHTMIHQY
ncbi:MAG: sigma-54-dependent Fis family transcriptional regulator [Nitrospinota bacterium]|nr:MAG: sigma-54-dependent Fis family transcriptional regulator [Nitrospinota bacterium]